MEKELAKFDYNKDTKIATCSIYDAQSNRTFMGQAKCHEEDFDMESEKVGFTIAQARMNIEIYKTLRDDSLIALKALKQLYYSMKHSSKFNPKSYENKMLQRKIKGLEDDVALIRRNIKDARKELMLYINIKDGMYKRIRANRSKSDNL